LVELAGDRLAGARPFHQPASLLSPYRVKQGLRIPRPSSVLAGDYATLDGPSRRRADAGARYGTGGGRV